MRRGKTTWAARDAGSTAVDLDVWQWWRERERAQRERPATGLAPGELGIRVDRLRPVTCHLLPAEGGALQLGLAKFVTVTLLRACGIPVDGSVLVNLHVAAASSNTVVPSTPTVTAKRTLPALTVPNMSTSPEGAGDRSERRLRPDRDGLMEA